MPNYIIDRSIIQQNAVEKESENLEFRNFLKQFPGDELDMLVHDLNAETEKQIDCTTCGACCRKLMINVSPPEAAAVAEHLNISSAEFKTTFLEESMEGMLVMNTIPCSFLKDSKCTVYEKRFDGCRAFPHLHEPQFKTRLFGTLVHYAMCPIIYNVIESLKIETGFVA